MRPAAAFALAQPHVGKRVILDSPALPRQWVLSLPIPLRVLLPAQPQRLRPLLQVVHRVLTRFLLGPAALPGLSGHRTLARATRRRPRTHGSPPLIGPVDSVTAPRRVSGYRPIDSRHPRIAEALMAKSIPIIVALSVFVLWMKVVGNPYLAEVAIGLLLATFSGVWVFFKTRRRGAPRR
jgi:hypothetical protein